MPKIFIYANVNLDDMTIGISKKVLEQIDAFKRLGFDVFYTCYKKDYAAVIDAQTNTEIMRKKYSMIAARTFRRNTLLHIATVCAKKMEFDMAYLRYHYFDFDCLSMLHAVRKSSKWVVMEMHSYPCLWPIFGWPGIFYCLDKWYTSKCTQYIDLFASMSSEILPFDRPQVTISNTMNPQAIKMRAFKGKTNVIKLLSVAFERETHGFDRVLNGLNLYYKNGGSYKFAVIFVGVYGKDTHQMVSRLNLQDVCTFVEPVAGEKLDELYNESDIAIGHLANHRIGSYSGSSIKVQEFLAKGIPFIYAWNEINIPFNFEYALKFDLNDEPLNFEEIIRFYEGIQDPCFAAKKMRTFFESFAGWENQIYKILPMEFQNKERQ